MMGQRVVVFDLGGVLIDWSPDHLYRSLIPSEPMRRQFLSEICTREWNETMDAGRSFADGCNELVSRFPDWSAEIRAYDQRWAEMISGEIKQNVESLQFASTLRGQSRLAGLYALSNWSSEKFPVAQARFSFLSLFDGLVVSGFEGVKKPDPQIYQILCARYRFQPGDGLFIDDVQANLDAASRLGFQTVLYQAGVDLKSEIRKWVEG
jgi:2-haloacid dehalogenase